MFIDSMDLALYDRVKRKASLIYSKPSAYKSGYIVQEYKRQGGKYPPGGKGNLARWFKEHWMNVASPGQYPVLRPTIRVNSKTPKTVSEITPARLREQVKLKQKNPAKNLAKF